MGVFPATLCPFHADESIDMEELRAYIDRHLWQAHGTVEDYYSGRLWDDAVCFSFYPIDLHTSRPLRMLERALAMPVMTDLDVRLRLMDQFPGYRQVPCLVSLCQIKHSEGVRQ
jgi:hypothetical protein